MPQPKHTEEVEAPARIGVDHIQDRVLSPVAGATKGYRRLDGLGWMEQQGAISGSQVEAGRRLQEDYAMSKMEGGSQSSGERTDGGRASYDIPQMAIDADTRVRDALAVLPPQILSMTLLFLLPDHRQETPTLENIAARVGRHKRVISFGIETALTMLARHYGN